MRKLATPISHLFYEDKSVFEDIIKYSDCLEGRDRTHNLTFPEEEIFHSDYQPIHELNDSLWKYFEKVAKTKPNIKMVSFHVASCCDQPVLNGRMWEAGGKIYSVQEMKLNAKSNFERLRKIFPAGTKFAIENNNYYPTKAYEHVCDADFISELASENDLFFLFDIAHSIVSAKNMKVEWNDYIKKLPLDRMIQVHICTPGDDSGLAFDAHEYPTNEILDVVKDLMKYPQLEYFTVEFYKDKDKLINSLKQVRKIINE